MIYNINNGVGQYVVVVACQNPDHLTACIFSATGTLHTSLLNIAVSNDVFVYIYVQYVYIHVCVCTCVCGEGGCGGAYAHTHTHTHTHTRTHTFSVIIVEAVYSVQQKETAHFLSGDWGNYVRNGRY